MRGATLSSKKLTITCINPLSDWRLISAHYITPESNMKDMRLEDMITKSSSSWLLNKFSLSASLEMYGEQYEEYAYWCWGVKG